MDRDMPVYECRKVPAGSIVIDGVLDDAGWREIQPVGEFILADGSGAASRQTEAKICWDDTYLYISFQCDDPDIWGNMLNRDDPICLEEVVEAFIDPDSDLKMYYEIEMSPRGTIFDLKITNPNGKPDEHMVYDESWDCPGLLTGVVVDGTLDIRDDMDKCWSVEWGIPFTSIPSAPNIPPKDGDTWRINLYRIDQTPTPEFSCWSPTLTDPPRFHIPARFGTIIFRE